MNRRRMMMAQQNKPDLLEGYRCNNNTYRMTINWLDNSNIEFSHTTWGFFGPEKAAVVFIGGWGASSTNWQSALSGLPLMSITESGKHYCLTLTVTEILQNTATVNNDGVLTLVYGRSTDAVTTSINFSELKVGTELKVAKSWGSAAGAAFETTGGNVLWDIKFKVDFEEV